MSSSSSDDETTIHRSAIYSQPKPGSSKRTTRHDVSDEEDEEPYARFRKEADGEVDERIAALLGTLHFEQKRDVVPSDEDDNRLRELHEKIFGVITNEPDIHRRRRLKKALPASNCVREQVFYLRRKPTTPPPSYYHRLNAALHTIVKESFGEEYRKVATILGLVEALAEVLILEVHAFGFPPTNTEHRNIRKLIANALTNLTYGQIQSKRRLCSYDGFVRCVVQIIMGSPNITQVYAGLIRNLSWNADSAMSEALQPTVHALAVAAVHAHTHRLDVTATLSALWNLAGHSVENKRTICDTPNCLKVLANILSPDARFTSLVDSATGILKYVAQYLATNSTHLELRSLLISRMLTLLKSSSFTCVTNTLGAIAHLIVKDPHMQQMIRQDAAAIQQLNVLRNSNRDDIRKAVKEVLNTLNQPCSRFGDMSLSVGGALEPQTSYHGTASPRLLSLRATRASPGKYVPQPMDHRSSSLPRHFAMQRNGFMMAQSYSHEQQQQMMYQMQQQLMIQTNEVEQQQQMMFLQQQQFHQQPPPQAPPPQAPPPADDDDVDIPTSTVMGTRSNSERSLGSMNPGSVMTNGGWNSTLDTAANSSRALSPVSYSDIPASPTLCAQVFQLGEPNQTHYSGGSANTMTRSDGTTVPIDNLITPTYATLNKNEEELESPVLPGPVLEEEEEEGDYAIISAEKTDDELLTRSIQAEKPGEASPKIRVSPRLNGFFSPRQQNQDPDRLLMESIRSEMPNRLSPRDPPPLDPRDSRDPRDPRDPRNSKNEEADRRDAVITTTIASPEPTDQQGTRRGSMEEEEEEEEEIDGSLPMDCVEEYSDDDDEYGDDSNATQYDDGVDDDPQMTIDCSMISGGSPRNALATSTPKGSASSLPGVRRATRVSTNGKTRLPIPKTNGSLQNPPPPFASNRPRLPPKPTILKRYSGEPEEEEEHEEENIQEETIYVNAPIVVEAEEQQRILMMKKEASSSKSSAVITPYNYQKPPITKYILRFEPAKRNKLFFTNQVLTDQIELFPDIEKPPVVKSFEFGTSEKLAANFLVLSPYTLQLYESWKIAGYDFSTACVFNIALQTLDAIQYLHQAGYVHRNIKPQTFSISDETETQLMFTDFRLTRKHLEGKAKKVRAARPKIRYGGTPRYASIAGLKEQEQGRKDDLESWIYMIYDMLDPENGISWRKVPRCEMLIKEKENFKKHVLPNTYKKVPSEFKKLVDMVHGMTYESVPDYPAFKEIVEKVGKSKDLDMKTCDWIGKMSLANVKNGVQLGVKKSTGNECEGHDDFEVKKPRKKMNPDDVIKNGGYTWKVIVLLGSGGFGDVYKVFDCSQKTPKGKNQLQYAMKTESEDGKKAMLRLKVEMQLLMAIQEDRKVPKEIGEGRNRRETNTHFVDFIDRGRSEDLQCKFIVMSLVGPSLDDIRKKYPVKLDKGNCPWQIAIQSLENLVVIIFI
uniref:Protein kinase domain-containing protein n=1 Tax=Caenorhabditis tropicalis TaxID=1561998 RepID=A0A1I7UC01_9PELO